MHERMNSCVHVFQAVNENYCLSKKWWPVLYSKLRYEEGQDFFDIQYIYYLSINHIFYLSEENILLVDKLVV